MGLKEIIIKKWKSQAYKTWPFYFIKDILGHCLLLLRASLPWRRIKPILVKRDVPRSKFFGTGRARDIFSVLIAALV